MEILQYCAWTATTIVGIIAIITSGYKLYCWQKERKVLVENERQKAAESEKKKNLEAAALPVQAEKRAKIFNRLR